MPLSRAAQPDPTASPRAHVIDINRTHARPSFPVRKERGLVEAVLEAFAQLEADRLAAAAAAASDHADDADSDADPASHLARKQPR